MVLIELKVVPVVLPFKDQSSADIVRAQLRDLSQKIQVTVRPVFVSHKIKQHLKPREFKLPIVNQESLVYQFKCDLCDAGYGMLVTHGGICINALTSTRMRLPPLESISVWNIPMCLMTL